MNAGPKHPTPPYVGTLADAIRARPVPGASEWWNGIEVTPAPSAFGRQEAGSHYSKMAVQPAHFIMANAIPWAEASAIQYIARWRDKGGLLDIRKAIHTLEMLIEHETGKGTK